MHWKQYYKTVYIWSFFLCSFFFTSTFILVFFYFSSKWVVLSVYFETRNFWFFSWSCIFFCPLLESCSYLVFLFDPPTIFRTQMIRNHDLPRWVFSNNQKKNFALPVVYSSYSPFAWFVTNCIHSAVELGRLAMYSVVYYNIVSNVWSFPKVAPPCYQ